MYGVEQPFALSLGEYGAHITFAWCVYDAPLLEIGGELADFKYKEYFPSLEAVGDWCRARVGEIEENARRVDGILTAHSLTTDLTHLLSQALHAYLASTWYCKRGAVDWYSCWEGGGYFQSSVDVEYSQAPFYLALWPQLLEMELCEWAEHTRDGETKLGEAGRGTLFMAHDMGQYCDCNGQKLWIDQELEETTNYVLMAYAVWKRTGSRRAIEQNADIIRRFLDFILATDTRGDGIPSYACHTTLDDACLPLRTGERLTYIAVKKCRGLPHGRGDFGGSRALRHGGLPRLCGARARNHRARRLARRPLHRLLYGQGRRGERQYLYGKRLFAPAHGRAAAGT